MLIKTKTLTPTDSKGTRIKASTVEDGSVSYVRGWDHSLGRTENHERGAEHLLIALGLDHLNVVQVASRKGVLYWLVEGEN